jgi:hypothetical protein
MNKELIVVIGAYGSGKSEYSVNLSGRYNATSKGVMLVDMDVVNPYFRTRDVREQFENTGIEVVAPLGENQYADIPMLSPGISAAISKYDKTVILDVGGDPAGCRTLARYIEDIKKRGYQMHLVVNTKRPFTADKAGIFNMIDMLEETSDLKITELVCNTNLMEYTDEEVVTSGIKIIEEAAKEKGLAFEKYLVLEDYDEKIPDNILGKTKMTMNYFLNKPWEMPLMRGL